MKITDLDEFQNLPIDPYTLRSIEDYPEYQAQPDEEYMSDQQLEHFKNKLLTWKALILIDLEETSNMLQEDNEHLSDEGDQAVKEEEYYLLLKSRDREARLMKKIDYSLRLIENGHYGYCEETEEKIGLARLEVRPTATVTIEVKRRQELEEELRGHR